MTEPHEGSSPYRRLPEPVPYDKLVATHETETLPDPQAGRDTETEFMLRYAG